MHVYFVVRQSSWPPYSPHRIVSSCLPRLLGATAHDLDFISRHVGGIVQLEIDVFDQERPYVVAEAVGVKMALTEGTGRQFQVV